MSRVSILTNPLMALGKLDFKKNRLDMYETLLEGQTSHGGNTPKLYSQFEAWAKRDLDRHQLRGYVHDYIAQRMRSGGVTFSQAVRPFVPEEEFLILSSSESSSDIVQALELVISHIKATEKMSSSMSAAMSQPIGGLLTVLAMSLMLGMSVWPELMRSIPRKYWPKWTLPCIDAQIWFAQHWWICAFVFVFAGLYFATLTRWTGKSRDWFDKVPPWSVYKSRQASNLLAVTASLLAAGKTVREAFVQVRDASSPYMAWHIDRLINRFDASGSNPMDALKTGLFSIPIMDRIEDSAVYQSFDQTLLHVGKRSLQNVLKTVQKQAVAASWGLMLVVAAIFIYVSFVTVFGVQDAGEAMFRQVGGTP